MNEWTIVGLTYVLAALVSLLVAVIIHIMGAAVKRFAAPEVPGAIDAEAQQGGSATIAPPRNEEAEIVAAIAAVHSYIARRH